MRGMLSCVLTIKFISPCYGFHGRDWNILHNHFSPLFCYESFASNCFSKSGVVYDQFIPKSKRSKNS